MSTLAELRKANLQEQKDQEAAPPESTAEVKAPETVSAPEPPALPSNRDHEKRQSARIAELLTGTPPVPQATPLSGTPTLNAPTLTLETVTGSESDQFLTRVRTSLTHKTLHPTGTKVTVDMTPALFHRAKRYCLDHGNVTLRQVFLDLLNEYLDEEGY